MRVSEYSNLFALLPENLWEIEMLFRVNHDSVDESNFKLNEQDNTKLSAPE